MAAVDERLVAVLQRSQQQGFLGPGELLTHIEHARAHAAAAQLMPGQRWCDLGSGGGVPGLVMAWERVDVEFVLLDRSRRRVDFLDTALRSLELGDRVTTALGDAAELAHLPQHRHTYDGVVSRAFGPPAAVAECSAGLLRAGGRLIVSQPPDDDETRWPAADLAELGLRLTAYIGAGPTFAALERSTTADAAYPRTWKHIRKRPLF